MSKILVIDDDTDLVEAARTLLESKGHTVSSAENGTIGYDKVKSEKPELVLLDVMMTYDSEGFDVARKLKEDPATCAVPIIMITGIRKAKNLPGDLQPDEDWLPVKAVLEKPVKPDQLLKAVEEALAK